MRNRLGSLTAELLAVDHPLVRHEDIRISEHQDVVVMLDVYFDDAGFGTHTFTTPKGTRAEHARPMFESRLTVGPVITVDI
jgi:hypothetical protein